MRRSASCDLPERAPPSSRVRAGGAGAAATGAGGDDLGEVRHGARAPRRERPVELVAGRVVVPQVHGDHVGAVVDRAHRAQPGELARERGEVVVAGAVVGAPAERLLEQHEVEAGVRPTPRSSSRAAARCRWRGAADAPSGATTA